LYNARTLVEKAMKTNQRSLVFHPSCGLTRYLLLIHVLTIRRISKRSFQENNPMMIFGNKARKLSFSVPVILIANSVKMNVNEVIVRIE
jgi:hypothetical protein